MPWQTSSRRFLIAGLVFVGAGLVISLLPGNYSTDIFVHDAYFVLPIAHLIWYAALLCGILAGINGLVGRTANCSLCEKLHSWFSVGGMCAVVGSLFLTAVQAQQGDSSMMTVLLSSALGGVLAFAVGQLILIFNAIYGLMKSLRRALA